VPAVETVMPPDWGVTPPELKLAVTGLPARAPVTEVQSESDG
jgi:hypothetical protein